MLTTMDTLTPFQPLPRNYSCTYMFSCILCGYAKHANQHASKPFVCKLITVPTNPSKGHFITNTAFLLQH